MEEVLVTTGIDRYEEQKAVAEDWGLSALTNLSTIEQNSAGSVPCPGKAATAATKSARKRIFACAIRLRIVI